MAAVQHVIDSEHEIHSCLFTMRQFWDSDVDVLLMALAHGSSAQQKRALTCMSAFIRQRPALNLDVARGLVPSLVDSLADSAHPQSQCDALGILTHLTAASGSNAARIASELPHIVKQVQGSNPRVVCCALRTVARLADAKETWKRTFDHAHPTIISLLHFNQTRDILLNALAVLVLFVGGKVRLSTFTDACVKICAKLACRPAPRVQAGAIIVLAVLTEHRDYKKELHPALAAVAPQITRLMLHSDEKLATAAAWWARTMADLTVQHKQSLTNAGITQICGRIIVEKSEMIVETPDAGISTNTVAIHAVHAISSMVSQTGTQIQATIDADLIPLLIYQVFSPAPEMAKAACTALSNACLYGSSLQRWYLLGEGLLQMCSELLTATTAAQRQVVREALSIICCFLRSERQFVVERLCSLGDVLEFCNLLEIPRMLLWAEGWFPEGTAQGILEHWFPLHSSFVAHLFASLFSHGHVAPDNWDEDTPLGTTEEDAVAYMHITSWQRRRHAVHAWDVEWNAELVH